MMMHLYKILKLTLSYWFKYTLIFTIATCSYFLISIVVATCINQACSRLHAMIIDFQFFLPAIRYSVLGGLGISLFFGPFTYLVSLRLKKNEGDDKTYL